ncbi:outer membrane beta-barrel protein [Luteolibacter flavescens]|uniref:Outer membrane beta-barrel protein n=1 Tax=Luteolibacter flavescens TaxID=1859460 RepID=A0ABT3FTN4_9BACT|nr:outer membrane beta-barrel protein [Luteolibacter flavescens]MCW1886940.1 outer membrane beta-barrel protein [Luteolibacter flavescens]
MPRAPRVVPMTIAALAAGVLAPSSAEELTSAAPGRLDGEVDSRIVPRNAPRLDGLAGKERSEELEMGIAISAAYDDNIFLSPNAQSDFVVKVSPAIAWRKGDPKEGEGGYIRAAYKPTGVKYSDFSDNDRVDQVASWEVGWRGQAIKLAYSGEARSLGDATADTGTLTDRTEFASEARVTWSVRERVAVEVAAGYESTTYDDSRFADSSNAYGGIALRYAYSPKTTLSAAYKFGRFEVDGAGPQDVHRTTARIEWKPREKIAVDIEVGAEHRIFDSGSDTTPVVEARVGWTPKEGTEIYLDAYRRERASAYLAGQNYTQGGVALGITQRLGEKWSAKLEGGVESAEYSRVSGAGIAGREDKIHFIRPAVEYRFTDDFSMGLFYRYSENRSNSRAFGYENHGAGIEMGYRF